MIVEQKKLKISDVYQYLPYELKGIVIFPNGDNEICVLMPRCGKNNRTDISDFVDGTYVTMPILKPLSDLSTAEMYMLGYLRWRGGETYSLDFLEFQHEKSMNLNEILEVFEYLYKNHYDVNNLIGRGLGVSVHDVNKFMNAK
jgi:hypothetical protein